MILVIGAGRLGQLIIEKFDAKKIEGSKTSAEQGFIKVNLQTDKLSSLDYDTFIFCVPPSSLNKEIWIERLLEIRDKKIIFISSTGVYGENSGVVSEKTEPKPNTDNGFKLMAIESLLNTFPESYIIRPSGLFSQNSHPGQYLAGRTDLKNGNDPINLISRDDVALVVKNIYELGSPKLVNLAHPSHPTKAEYYSSYCKRHNLLVPTFKEEHSNLKVITSIHKIIERYTELP